MTRSTGKIPYKNLSTIMYNTRCSSQYMKEVIFMYDKLFTQNHQTNKFIKYKFYLDKTLRLNVTFLELYIQHTAELSHISSCWFGFVNIVSILSGLQSMVSYCGKLASVSCYPVSYHVIMMFYTGVFVTVRAEIFYSVFDRNTLQSIQAGSTKVKKPQGYQVFIFPRNQLELSIFGIRTDPMMRMCVVWPNITDIDLKAFNGPGTKSKQLTASRGNNSQSFFAATKFQMTIYLLRQLGDSLVLSHTSLAKRGLAVSVNEFGKHLSLPQFGSCMNELFCLITLNTSRGHKLNLTLKNFQYEGEKNLHECQYAGIWVADHDHKTNTPLNEIYSECVKEYLNDSYEHDCFVEKRDCYYVAHNISTTERLFPEPNNSVAVFSRTNTVSIVYYSFQEYGVLSLQIQISLIQCEVIQSDLCQLEGLYDNLNPSNIFSIKKPNLFYLLFTLENHYFCLEETDVLCFSCMLTNLVMWRPVDVSVNCTFTFCIPNQQLRLKKFLCLQVGTCKVSRGLLCMPGQRTELRQCNQRTGRKRRERSKGWIRLHKRVLCSQCQGKGVLTAGPQPLFKYKKHQVHNQLFIGAVVVENQLRSQVAFHVEKTPVLYHAICTMVIFKKICVEFRSLGWSSGDGKQNGQPRLQQCPSF